MSGLKFGAKIFFMLPLLLSVSSFDSSGFLTELVAAFVMFFVVAFGDVFSAELGDAFCVVAVVTVKGFCVTVVFCVCDAFSFCSASSLASTFCRCFSSRAFS